MKGDEIKKAVREGYARVAKRSQPCCTPAESCCAKPDLVQDASKRIGYTDEELEGLPEGANLGLGCGNPVALASLKEGETVLDLGSGAGVDCFLAARKVGETGRVIGVDMTPEMVERAEEVARNADYKNVEFRLGEIEKLPLDDSSVDVILSNCVINLVPDKSEAFREACRVLKPGGRLMISDIVLLKELPDMIKDSIEAYVGCLSGAMLKEEYLGTIRDAGLQEVRVIDETPFPLDCIANGSTAKAIAEGAKVSSEEITDIADSVLSVKVQAVKPRGTE